MDSIEDFKETLEVARGQDFKDLAPAWFEYAHIASPDEAKPVTDYLHSLVKSVLILPDVHVSSVRFLISDDDDPNACVINDDPDDAVIYVTRGLFKYVDSEDMLSGILKHEIGHVEVSARIGKRHRNSRPEEIGADGFAAQWMVKTGRNWRAFQRFFKKLAADEEKFADKKPLPHKFKQQIADVHSTALDRVQHTQTAVGILAIQEKRDIPEPEEKQIPQEIMNAVEQLRHRSYIDLVLEQEQFLSLTPAAQLEMLVNIDPRHYQRKIFLPEARKSGEPYAEAMTQDYACHERSKRYQALVLETLRKVAAEKDKDAEWTAVQAVLLNKAVDAAGLYTEMHPYTSKAYIHLNNPVYQQVNKMLFGPDAFLMPLGTRLGQLAEKLSAFVGAGTYNDALAAASEMKEEMERHTAVTGSIGMFERDDEWRTDLVLYKSLVMPGFHEDAKQKTRPWARHVTWAAEDKTGVIAEILWRAGVNKDKKLWNAIPVDQMEKRQTEWNFTQPAGALSRYSMTDKKLLDAIANNKQWHYIQPKRVNGGTQGAADIPVNYSAMNRFKEFAKKKIAAHFNKVALAVPVIQPGTLATTLMEFILKNEKLLTAPQNEEREHFPEPDYDQDFSIHAHRTQALVDAIDNCLQAGNVEDREAAKKFFMMKHVYANVAAPCMCWLTRGWKEVYPPDSPLIRFVEDDRYGLFTAMEKASLLLKHCEYSAGDGHDGRNDQEKVIDKPFWRAKFGYEQPQSFSELADLGQQLDINYQDGKEADEDDHRYQWGDGDSDRRLKRSQIFDQELKQFLEKNPAVPSLGFAKLAQFYLDEIKPSILSGFMSVTECKRISSILKGDKPDLKSVVFDADLTDMTLEHMIDAYLFMDHEGLLPNLPYKFAFGKKIMTNIQAMPDGKPKIALLERLAFTAQRKVNRPMSDFVLAEKALTMWANLAAQSLGMDDGSDEYCNSTIPLLEKIERGVSERDRFHAFRAFADAIVAQRPVCHDIEKRLTLRANDIEIMKADIAMRGAETFFSWVRKTKANREKTLDFLMQTENEDAITDMSDGFIAWLDEYPINRKAIFVSEIGVMALGEMGGTNDDVRDKMRDPELNKKIREKTDQIAQSMHRLFWSRSLEMRTVFSNYVLITPEELNTDPEAAWRNGLSLTLDRLFASEVKDPDEKLRNEWSREFLTIYLESAHESERSLIMAALISSAQTEASGYAQSFGERLTNILCMLGPAYYKLGQAIHSHPHTPEDIRTPMAKLKSLGEKPPRWTYLRSVDDAVPHSMQEKIAWTGDIVGRASFFTTSPVKMVDGDEYMLGILGKNAASEATHGFKRLESCANKLAAKNRAFAAISQTAIAMIRQAHDLVKVETDMNLGAQQSVYMQELYGGLVAEADGHKFHYDPKAWRWYGDNFKLMDIAPGCHFDEMPEITPAQAARKKAFAKADSAVELMLPLARKRSDNDRHERQMKIQGDVVGLFDPGGVLLEEPSENDMQSLAEALKIILPAATGKGEGKDTATVLSKYLTKLEEKTGAYPVYLMHVQKSLLSRSGFHRYLEAKDFSDIVTGLVRGNHIDPIIRKALIFDKANVSLSAGLGMLRGAFQAPSVKISREKVPTPAAPIYVAGTGSVKSAKIEAPVIVAPIPAKALQFAA